MAPFEIGSLASSPEPVLSPDSTVQCELECRRQASEVTNAALGGGADPQKEAGCRCVWRPSRTIRKRTEQGQRLRDTVGVCLLMVLVGSWGSQEGGSTLYEDAI